MIVSGPNGVVGIVPLAADVADAFGEMTERLEDAEGVKRLVGIVLLTSAGSSARLKSPQARTCGRNDQWTDMNKGNNVVVGLLFCQGGKEY